MEGKLKQSSNGKGSKDRVKDIKKFKENYLLIKWDKKLKDGKSIINVV